MAKHGVSGVCADDVRAVAPVVIDRPDIQPRSNPPIDPVTPTSTPTPVVREIMQIANNFTYIDNHPTVVDMSTNQNIWAMGDVSQVFDQDATVASGAGSLAAGDDVTGASTSAQGNTFDDDVTVDSDIAVASGPEQAAPPAASATTAGAVDPSAAALTDAGVPSQAVDAVEDAVYDLDDAADDLDGGAPVPADLPVDVDESVWTPEPDAIDYGDSLYSDIDGEQ